MRRHIKNFIDFIIIIEFIEKMDEGGWKMDDGQWMKGRGEFGI